MKKIFNSSAPKLLHFISHKSYIIAILFIAVLLSGFLVASKANATAPCINSDEASHGYNAYSILKTGADEYGEILPVRFKSFGEYKFPLYSYFSVPFIATLGLNEYSVRTLNIVVALLFPLAVYFLTKELFRKEEIGVIAAMLTSTSLGIGIVSSHAHEVLLATFLITVSSYFFIKFFRKETYLHAILFVLPLTFALFTYQSSRLFALFFFLFAIGYYLLFKKKSSHQNFFIIIFIVAISLFAITDIMNKPSRVESLFLTNNPGFSLRINELVGEGGSRLFYNKFAIGLKDIIYNHSSYYSPQFLAINGDANLRFGFPKMAPMTLLEYLFIFVGIYYLFRNKERWRYFIVGLFLVSPLTAALSWAEISITRSFFLIIASTILSAYGFYNILLLAKQRKLLIYVLGGLILVQSFFLYYSWDFFINHYPKRAAVIRAWQCGYKELGVYVTENKSKFDKFYITKKNGQPYIYMLFYLNFPPKDYQKQASLSALDEYGFGQVEKFDKYIFSIPDEAFNQKNVSIIGYPDDFGKLSNDEKKKIKKIIIGTEEIFWIYET